MLQTLEREPQETYHGMPHHPPIHGGPHGKFSLNFKFGENYCN